MDLIALYAVTSGIATLIARSVNVADQRAVVVLAGVDADHALGHCSDTLRLCRIAPILIDDRAVRGAEQPRDTSHRQVKLAVLARSRIRISVRSCSRIGGLLAAVSSGASGSKREQRERAHREP